MAAAAQSAQIKPAPGAVSSSDQDHRARGYRQYGGELLHYHGGHQQESVRQRGSPVDRQQPLAEGEECEVNHQRYHRARSRIELGLEQRAYREDGVGNQECQRGGNPRAPVNGYQARQESARTTRATRMAARP